MSKMLPQYDTAVKTAGDSPSPLISYTLRGLRTCWMPEHERWSHIYHLDNRAANESVPSSDVFYSLNVLVGFARIAHLDADHGFNLPAIFQKNVALVPKLDSQKYAYGTALWAAAELGLEIPQDTLAEITALIEDRNVWKSFRAQDLGMILVGVVEQARRNPSSRWAAIAHELFKFLDQHYSCPTGLFFDTVSGARRSFSSFATNVYLTLGSFLYGEWAGNDRALALGSACTRKLIELQGPQGEWPWFYYTPGGRVVDPYEVYHVHQTGMAPAFLECAERHGVPGATEAIVKGFKWVFGQNQMNKSMLRKKEGMIYRSQLRKGELHDKRKRMIRAVANAATGRSAGLIDPSELELRLECRSYELGWILWSFGKRADLKEITEHPEFR